MVIDTYWHRFNEVFLQDLFGLFLLSSSLTSSVPSRPDLFLELWPIFQSALPRVTTRESSLPENLFQSDHPLLSQIFSN